MRPCKKPSIGRVTGGFECFARFLLSQERRGRYRNDECWIFAQSHNALKLKMNTAFMFNKGGKHPLMTLPITQSAPSITTPIRERRSTYSDGTGMTTGGGIIKQAPLIKGARGVGFL